MVIKYIENDIFDLIFLVTLIIIIIYKSFDNPSL